MADVKISVAQVVGGGICVSAEDGHKLHDIVYGHIKKGDRVRLSFSGITRMTTAFLNAAIGQLYGEFNSEQVRAGLAPPEDAEPWHLVRIKLVVDRARYYFEQRDRGDAIIERVTGLERDDN